MYEPMRSRDYLFSTIELLQVKYKIIYFINLISICEAQVYDLISGSLDFSCSFLIDKDIYEVMEKILPKRQPIIFRFRRRDFICNVKNIDFFFFWKRIFWIRFLPWISRYRCLPLTIYCNVFCPFEYINVISWLSI